MGQPKRKQSKQRSRKRRGANGFSGPELARDPATGSLFKPHHVNPETGMYRGRQIIEIKD
ncbi:MAG: 50S ribosomal protein L32 [Puniceicoccales bacterium]|jgi:large subunit ribosomal protein L32|nr:50S ribosomal protein L32 [Puniceicoccales bacterium]